MAAYNFPNSPSNGDTVVINGVTYTYNSTKNAWKDGSAVSSGSSAFVIVGNTAPSTPSDGDLWFDTANNELYVYIDSSNTWADSATFSQVDYVTKVGYDLSNPSDTNAIVLDAGSAVTQATYYGDVIDKSANNLVVLDISNRNFYGNTNGSHFGDVYDVVGNAIIIDTDGGTLNSPIFYGEVDGSLIGNTTVSGHFTPTANVTYNLGSDTKRWNDLYLSGNTIYLGSLELSENSNTLQISYAGANAETFATQEYVQSQIATKDQLSELSGTTDDITEGSNNLYYTDARVDTNFSTKTTTDLAEGTNLYYTDARADARVNLQTGTNLDLSQKTTTDLAEGTNLYYTTARANTDFDARLAAKTTTDLAEGTNLYYTDGRADARVNLQTGANLDLSNKTTSDLAEGTNLYYTDARARAAISENSTQLSYNSTTGVLTFTQGDTDTVSEGATNLYFTDARARSAISATGDLSYNSSTGVMSFTETTTTLSIASNILSYVDEAGATTNIDLSLYLDDTNLARLTSGAVDANGLATFTRSDNTTFTVDFAVLFDDTNLTRITSGSFSNNVITLTRSDSSTAATIDLSTTYLQNLSSEDTDDLAEGVNNLYYTNARADARINLQTGANLDLSQKTTSDLSEGTNLYYTDARARAAISENSAQLSYNSTTGVLTYTQGDTDTVAEGATNLYYTTARANTDFDARLAAKTTTDLAEGTNLYYTDARADARIALQVGANLDLTQKNTDDLAEGSTNLYYTDTRARTHIEGADLDLGTNKILFSNMYATTGDLPSATSYHGMFAHVHGTGAAYYAHAGNWVELANASNIPTVPTLISDLTDVSNTSPLDGQALVWDNASSEWAPGNVVSSTALNDLTDVSTVGATSGQVLKYNGSSWAPAADATGGGGGASVTSSNTAPSSPSEGDLWFDTSDLTMYVYYDDGSNAAWITVTPEVGGSEGVTVSSTPPTSPSYDDLWFDDTNLILYIYFYDGNSAQWVQTNPSGGGSTTTTNTYQEQTQNYTAVAGDRLIVDTSNTVTITLPASASLSDEIRIIDGTGNASINNITVARNGHNIEGLAQDLTVNVDRAAFGLVYYNATQGWIMTER